ncbi:hypothetical protein IW262DRAFT_973666 [Armillaria fumosa]|nr:hypothetical protein IW262DRAFT_973666 [Armillaria fumosa]
MKVTTRTTGWYSSDGKPDVVVHPQCNDRKGDSVRPSSSTHADILTRRSGRLVHTGLYAGVHTLSMSPDVDISFRHVTTLVLVLDTSHIYRDIIFTDNLEPSDMRPGGTIQDFDLTVSPALDGGDLEPHLRSVQVRATWGKILNSKSQFEDVNCCVDRKALRSVIFDTDQIFKSFLIETFESWITSRSSDQLLFALLQLTIHQLL